MFTSGLPASWIRRSSFYTSGAFKPTDITFHSKKAEVFGGGSTAVVLTDCDYGLLLDGKPTTHHFMVTEVYVPEGGRVEAGELYLYGAGILNKKGTAF